MSIAQASWLVRPHQYVHRSTRWRYCFVIATSFRSFDNSECNEIGSDFQSGLIFFVHANQ